MNHLNNNINLATRIINIFRTENVSKLVATAAVGLALTIGVAMPGSASADVPSVSNPGSFLFANWTNDHTLVFGTATDYISAPAKLIAKSSGNVWTDDFTLVYGTLLPS